MKYIKTTNTWNLTANAQPQIPTLSLSIEILFQTCRGPNAWAPLGWRSASFFSHFSTLSTAGLTLSANPLAFFKAQPWILKLSLTLENNTDFGFHWEMFHLISWPNYIPSHFKQSILITHNYIHCILLIKFNYQLHLLDKATLQIQTAQRTPKRI